MFRLPALLAAVLLLATSQAAAQHHLHPPAPGEAPASTPKALSPAQLADLREGRGMGLARAAELNFYPGPAHALELADELGLTAEQRTRLEQIRGAMTAAARRAGAAVIEAEAALDRLFAERRADPESLRRAILVAGERQAELRLVHLSAHLDAAELLSPQQRRRYAVLRGYSRE